VPLVLAPKALHEEGIGLIGLAVGVQIAKITILDLTGKMLYSAPITRSGDLFNVPYNPRTEGVDGFIITIESLGKLEHRKIAFLD